MAVSLALNFKVLFSSALTFQTQPEPMHFRPGGARVHSDSLCSFQSAVLLFQPSRLFLALLLVRRQR